MKIKVNTLIPLFSLILGIFWVFYGLSNHGFWHPARGPAAGFVPSLIAGALALVSIPALLQSFREKNGPDRMENWTIVLASCVVFSLVFLFGMMISLMAFVFVWLKIYEEVDWKNTIVLLIISLGIMYGVFVLWLRVPLPNGLLLDAIMGYVG